MARPIKQDADWFHHDKGMRNDPRIRSVRRKYGLEGYAIFNMLCEVMTDADGFFILDDSDFYELTSGDFDIEPEKLREIMSYFEKLGLLVREVSTGGNPEKLYSRRLKRDLDVLIEARNSDRQGFHRRKYTEQNRREKNRIELEEGEENALARESPPISPTALEEGLTPEIIAQAKAKYSHDDAEICARWKTMLEKHGKPDFFLRDYPRYAGKRKKPSAPYVPPSAEGCEPMPDWNPDKPKEDRKDEIAF